tara:strand:- start:82 stop:312 length:231 start_codon:yes stop_codon:yes gene_type:complete
MEIKMALKLQLQKNAGSCTMYITTNLKRQIMFLGDKKTNKNWSVHYLDNFDIVIPDDQPQLFGTLAKAIKIAQIYV